MQWFDVLNSVALTNIWDPLSLILGVPYDILHRQESQDQSVCTQLDPEILFSVLIFGPGSQMVDKPCCSEMNRMQETSSQIITARLDKEAGTSQL